MSVISVFDNAGQILHVTWTNVTRTNVAWTNVTLTIVHCEKRHLENTPQHQMSN